MQCIFCYQVILSCIVGFVFFLPSAGAVHPAGSVPRRGGSRDGREAQPHVLGGLANSGPRPAQPGRSRPGESVRTLQERTGKRKGHSEQTGGWKEEQILITGSENSCHLRTFVFRFVPFLFLRFFVFIFQITPRCLKLACWTQTVPRRVSGGNRQFSSFRAW